MKPRRKQREKRAHAGLWTVLVVLVGLGLAGFGGYQGVMALIDSWCKDLPNVEETSAFETSAMSTIYANDYDGNGGGTVLAELYLEKREPLESLDQVSPYVVAGTVATEDVRFYQHNGADLQGIFRAVAVNLAGGQEGASTITQQLVRNTLLSDEMTEISLKRKVREIELATQMEKHYSKDEIILMYLNTINYGDGCYGIQAAAENYYGVSASDLSIAQAATLIGIPNSPTMYDPYLNPDACLERRGVVLSRMLTNGVITEEEYEQAKAEGLDVREQSENETYDNGIYLYDYFTTYVRDLLLKPKDEGGYGISTEDLFKGGMTIVTSLDPTMQRYAEEAVAKQEESERLLDGQELALTLIDPNTGFIKAMIGGENFENDQLNIATSADGRQMGSTAKAFTLAAAIEAGIDPASKMNCNGPVEVPNNGTTMDIYNYDRINYGTMSIADMTAVSSNTGYIRLSYTDSEKSGVTPQSIVEMQKRLGLSDTMSDGTVKLPAVTTTTLGVGNANTTEMAAAYGTFAAGGVYREPTAVVKIIKRDGSVHTDNSAGVRGEQKLSESTAHAVTEVLEGTINKSIGTATAAALPSGQIAAGKTGTTNDWYDLWFVGYTPQLSCAVWTGDRYNQTQLYTSSWCQDVWRDLISNCLAGQPKQDFKDAPDPDYDSKYKGSYGTSASSDKDEPDATDDADSTPNENDTPDDSTAHKPEDEGANTIKPDESTPGSEGGGGSISPDPSEPIEPTLPGGGSYDDL